MNTDPRFEEGDFEDLKRFVAEPGRVHFVCMASRPGLHGCMSTLEETHYDPKDPAKNAKFELRLINWQLLRWVMVSIPEEDRHLMDRAAGANGLRVANGTPHIISGDGKGGVTTDKFPAEGDHVFTLENVSGHPVYKQTMDTLREAAKRMGK